MFAFIVSPQKFISFFTISCRRSGLLKIYCVCRLSKHMLARSGKLLAETGFFKAPSFQKVTRRRRHSQTVARYLSCSALQCSAEHSMVEPRLAAHPMLLCIIQLPVVTFNQ